MIDWLIEASRCPVQNSHMSVSYDITERKKLSNFDIKSWVTCGTKIWPGKVVNWRIFSQIDSTLRVKLAQHSESNWLNIESQVDSTLRFKLTQHWESSWLEIESQVDSKLRVKLSLGALSEKNESFWPKKLGQILVSPLTRLFRSKWHIFFFLLVHWEKSFWPKKLGKISVSPVTQVLKSKWLNYFSQCTERKNWVILI